MNATPDDEPTPANEEEDTLRFFGIEKTGNDKPINDQTVMNLLDYPDPDSSLIDDVKP